MTKEIFRGLTADMKKIDIINYIREYCENRYDNFELDLCFVEQSAYTDTYFYIDYKRKFCVYDRVYIGD